MHANVQPLSSRYCGMQMRAFIGTCDALECTTVDNYWSSNDLTWDAVFGTTHFLVVTGYSYTNYGDFILHVRILPPANVCDNAIDLVTLPVTGLIKAGDTLLPDNIMLYSTAYYFLHVVA